MHCDVSEGERVPRFLSQSGASRHSRRSLILGR